MSLLHFASSVIILPRYLNFLTCLIPWPSTVILHFGTFFFLVTTIVSVFFMLTLNPFSKLSSTTTFINVCNCSSDSAIMTASS